MFTVDDNITLQIDNADLELSKDFLIQYVRDALQDSNYSDISVEDGTAIHDVAIKIYALLYVIFKGDVEKSKAYLSLDHATAKKDELGDEYDTVVDSILSNWFVTRKTGIKTNGIVRLVFSSIVGSIVINTGLEVGKSKGVPILSSHDYIFGPEDFNLRTNIQSHQSEYYVDISAESGIDTEELLTSDDTLTSSIVGWNSFIKAEILYPFSPGSLKESSEAFINRTQQVINTRELICERAVNTVLMEEYASITSIHTVGHGDEAQLRDISEFEQITLHIGNKADYYINAPVTKTSLSFTLAEIEGSSGVYNKIITIPGIFVTDIIGVTSVRPAGIAEENFTAVDYDFNYYTGLEYEPGSIEYGNYIEGMFSSPDFTTSIEITSDLQVVDEEINPTIEVTFLVNTTVQDVNTYMKDMVQRVMAYDPVVKSKFIVRIAVDMEIAVLRDTSRLNPPTDASIITGVQDAIIAYTEGIPAGETFVWSKAITAIHEAIPEVTKINTISDLMYTLRNPLGLENITGEFEEDFSLERITEVVLSKQLTYSALRFYADDTILNVSIIN